MLSVPSDCCDLKKQVFIAILFHYFSVKPKKLFFLHGRILFSLSFYCNLFSIKLELDEIHTIVISLVIWCDEDA